MLSSRLFRIDKEKKVNILTHYAPQKHDFDIAVMLDKWYSKLLLLNFGLALMPSLQKLWQSNTIINDVIFYLNIVSIIGMCIIGLLQKHWLNKAENIRRDALLDDAFETKLGDESAIGYYDNFEMRSGYRKLLANIYQNSLFSFKIASKMKNKLIILLIVLGVVITYCMIKGFSNVAFSVPLLQLFLSGLFVEKIYNLYIYRTNVKWVQDKAKEINEGLSHGQEIDEKNIVKILQLFLRYETNISRTMIILDEKIFTQMNSQLTETWNNLKKRYSIY